MREGNTFISKHHLLHLEHNEAVTLASIRNGDELAFEIVFKEHFKSLYGYAIGLVKNESAAEEIVQNVFFKIWKKKELLPPSGLLKAYLYRAVHNESLNLIKHNRVRSSYQLHAVRSGEAYPENATGKVSLAELQRYLAEAMNCLPEQCRTIFQMSRFEEKKCKEIAEELQIAPKTVENQLGKALKILRVKLKDFLPFFFYLFINLKP